MSSVLEEIKPETADLISEQAKAQRLSVDEYLNDLLSSAQASRSRPMSLAEIDQILNELSEGTGGLPPLPGNFSREDIYFDHD